MSVEAVREAMAHLRAAYDAFAATDLTAELVKISV